MPKKKRNPSQDLIDAAKAHLAMRDAMKTMEGNPWDVPIGGGPEPIEPSPMASPSPPPVGPVDDAFSQAQKLEQQRSVWKNLIPEGWWNK